MRLRLLVAFLVEPLTQIRSTIFRKGTASVRIHHRIRRYPFVSICEALPQSGGTRMWRDKNVAGSGLKKVERFLEIVQHVRIVTTVQKMKIAR